ncbi:MAG: hypothetical protein ABIT37_20490 [Luteolibacter sp.]
MKSIATLILTIGSVSAGELIVLMPCDKDSNGFGIGDPFVESFADGSFEIEPKVEMLQEGQIIKYVYDDVKPGMYRVALDADGNSIGCTELLMESHVEIEEDASVTIFLYAPRNRAVNLPSGIAAALKAHPKGMMFLSANYQGSAKSFFQIRSLPRKRSGGLESWIHYLRPNAEYTIEILDEVQEGKTRNTKTIFKKTFKIGDGISGVEREQKQNQWQQDATPSDGAKPSN